MIQQWLLEQTDQLLSASNVTIAVMMFVLGTVVLRYLVKLKYTEHVDLFHMLFGIVVEAYGWALHRAYYALLNLSKLYDNEPMVHLLNDHRYITLVSVLMVMVGLSLILGPAISMVTKAQKSHRHNVIVFLLMCSIMWLMYWKFGSAYEYSRVTVKEKHIERLMDTDPSWNNEQNEIRTEKPH